MKFYQKIAKFYIDGTDYRPCPDFKQAKETGIVQKEDEFVNKLENHAKTLGEFGIKTIRIQIPTALFWINEVNPRSGAILDSQKITLELKTIKHTYQTEIGFIRMKKTKPITIFTPTAISDFNEIIPLQTFELFHALILGSGYLRNNLSIIPPTQDLTAFYRMARKEPTSREGEPDVIIGDNRKMEECML